MASSFRWLRPANSGLNITWNFSKSQRLQFFLKVCMLFLCLLFSTLMSSLFSYLSTSRCNCSMLLTFCNYCVWSCLYVHYIVLKCVVSQSNVCLVLVAVMFCHRGLVDEAWCLAFVVYWAFSFYATVAVVCCVFCTAVFGKYCFVVIGYDLFYIWYTSVA